MLDAEFVAAFRAGKLTAEQADLFAQRDPLEIRFLLMHLGLAMVPPAVGGAHMPSGSIPRIPGQKWTPTKKANKHGAKSGHPGASRPVPERIDRHAGHRLPACPCCQGQLTRTERKRTRLVEDIPESLKSEVTEHTIHRDLCPKCKIDLCAAPATRKYLFFPMISHISTRRNSLREPLRGCFCKCFVERNL